MRAYLRTAGLLVFAVGSLGPYAWLAANAFRTRTEITASPPRLPSKFSLENFSWVYNGQNLIDLIANSAIVSGGTVCLSFLIGVPAAYYFARQKSGVARNLFLLVLATRMAPPIALSLPMFVLFTEIGLRGTYMAPIAAHTIFSIAFVVWFLEGFVSDIPKEVEMAAQVDGRSRLGALLGVVLPALRMPLVATAAFVALFSWNEYMMASLLTSSTTRPLTPALPGFIAQATSQWGSFCAVALVSTLPALAVAAFCRRFLARAFSAGMVNDAEG